MPKSVKVWRRKLQSGDRKSFGTNLQNDLGSLPRRSRGFAGFGCPVGVAGPNVAIVPSEHDDPKGPQSKHKETNGVIMTRVFEFFFEIAKVSRIVVSGGFRCGACWWLLGGTPLLCDFIIGSVIVYLRRKTAHVWSKTVFLTRMPFSATPNDTKSWNKPHFCGNSYYF